MRYGEKLCSCTALHCQFQAWGDFTGASFASRAGDMRALSQRRVSVFYGLPYRQGAYTPALRFR